ncbi:homoserine kinase [Dongshaea marina]|uniref:homoserine kinase n=1 Tax=Dongshaea marina TaxID=2047966 RepID=UPI000D3E1AAD|nr:homoserine kinase [Dongshaea marina]
MTSVAYAPASIGNVSVGFDLLGAALRPVDGSLLGDRVFVSATRGPLTLDCSGPCAGILPADPSQNLVYRAAEYFLHRLRKPLEGLHLHLEKNLPICSGLGSSASSIVAAFTALNHFFKSPFESSELLQMMAELEGQISGSVHYDNVAPAFLGGMQLIQSEAQGLSCALPIFENWRWVVCYPGYKIATEQARGLLPNQYPRHVCIDFGRKLATFVQSCYTQNASLAASVLNDELAEPYRSPLIPGFANACSALSEQGALAVGISGSGPTLFALADCSEVAETVNLWFENHFIESEQGFSHICQLDSSGADAREELDVTV